MTPGARIAAAIDLLDAIAAGERAERALLRWARASRFAGARDREAVRDHVYGALRCRRSYAALGGGGHGRGLMLGALRAAGTPAETLFTGAGHAPAPPDAAERAHLARPVALSEGEALDVPDWLLPHFRASLGPDMAPALEALRQRAPLFVRVNLARATRQEAVALLAREGVVANFAQAAKSALEVVDGKGKVSRSEAFLSGLVELQDAASQAVVEALPLGPGCRVLDYCAGGGGKALAVAARLAAEGLGGTVLAHDAAPARLRDLPQRARRAGADIAIRATAELAAAGPFDLVLLDVPCSGSGSWRRDPEGKWRLDPAGLAALGRQQAAILAAAPALLRPGGHVAYVTCSLLADENEARIAAFLAGHAGWHCLSRRRWSPADGTDGFFLALLTRD